MARPHVDEASTSDIIFWSCAVVKPLMELLAGVPTVVYGFFAALTVAPFIRSTGMSLGLDVASESALAAGLVMGVKLADWSRVCGHA